MTSLYKLKLKTVDKYIF